MDQVKIGKFIAKRRKLQNLTQMQLAELPIEQYLSGRPEGHYPILL